MTDPEIAEAVAALLNPRGHWAKGNAFRAYVEGWMQGWAEHTLRWNAADPSKTIEWRWLAWQELRARHLA